MQLMNVSSWNDYKTLLSRKMLLIQYSETTSEYNLFAPEAHEFLWQISLLKESDDAIDFETNYKANANQPLEIKEKAGKPVRISPSAQPAGTSEAWKGFSLDFANDDTEKTHYVTFNNTVSLRGGYMLADNVLDGDIMNVTVEAFDGQNWSTVGKPWDNIPLSRTQTAVFVSNESMEFPTYLRLAVTITSKAASARKYYGVANFFV